MTIRNLAVLGLLLTMPVPESAALEHHTVPSLFNTIVWSEPAWTSIAPVSPLTCTGAVWVTVPPLPRRP